MAMNTFLRASTVIVCLASLSTQVRAQAPFVRRDVVSAEALHSAGYGKYWSGSIELSEGDRVAAVNLVDDNLYVHTRLGAVYAVQADTGLLRWGISINDRLFRELPPTHAQVDSGDGPALLVSASRLFVIDRYSGEKLDVIDLPFSPAGAAVGDATSIYLGGMDDKFYALRRANARRFAGLVRWRVHLEGSVSTPTILTLDGRLYFATNQGRVYCVHGATKRLEWAFQTDGTMDRGLAASDAGVFIGDARNRFYILDPRRGVQARQFLLPGPIFDAPVIAQRSAYVYSDHQGLFAFDADTRKQIWRLDDARRFVARAAERLVLRMRDGSLWIGDSASAAPFQTLDIPESTIVAQNRRDDVLFMSSVDGRLLCAKRLGFPYLRREKVTMAHINLHRHPGATDGANGADRHSIETTSAASTASSNPLRSKYDQ